MVWRGFQYVFTCGTCRDGCEIPRRQALWRGVQGRESCSLWPLPMVPLLCQVPLPTPPPHPPTPGTCPCSRACILLPYIRCQKRCHGAPIFKGLRTLKSSEFKITKNKNQFCECLFRAHFRVCSKCLINANWPKRKPSGRLSYNKLQNVFRGGTQEFWPLGDVSLDERQSRAKRNASVQDCVWQVRQRMKGKWHQTGG